MAKCVGCGLTVNSGILEVELCPSGGIACKPEGTPGCPDGGLAVKLCQDGGITYEPSCNDQFGVPGGLKVNFTSPTVVGCGLTTDAQGRLIPDLADNPTNCNTNTNLLKCIDGQGLAVHHQSSVAGNSGVCGANATTPIRAYTFLLPPLSASDIGVPTNFGVGQYDWHTDTWLVGPDCTDPTQVWAGNTIFDMGGVNFDLAPGSLVRVVTEISQGYADSPISFGASPLQRMTFDTRGITVRNQFDFQSHDTTWQVVSGGQKLRFQMRMRVNVEAGSVIVSQFGAIWEANWHYSHVTGPISSFSGCENP